MAIFEVPIRPGRQSFTFNHNGGKVDVKISDLNKEPVISVTINNNVISSNRLLRLNNNLRLPQINAVMYWHDIDGRTDPLTAQLGGRYRLRVADVV